MKTLHVYVVMATAILSVRTQVTKGAEKTKECICELNNSGLTFPTRRLQNVMSGATDCTQKITTQQMSEVDILMDKLHHRLRQLEQDVVDLEQEDDGSSQQGDLYMAVSLRIIEIELAEILDLVSKLNTTTAGHQGLSKDISIKLKNMNTEMESLEKFDHTQIVQKQKQNQVLMKALTKCQADMLVTVAPPVIPVPGNCFRGNLLNVTGPSTYTVTEYGTSYAFGAWGRDPKPAKGKEDWYWLVALTSSNIYANYIRWYSSHSAIVVGVKAEDVLISSSNPTTNTVQGPNVAMYENALYYSCYNSPTLCRFNMTARTITTTALTDAGHNNKFPFCHLGTCYGYTDVDVSTDESGLWVVYATPENFGNVVLSKVEVNGTASLGRTWRTSLHKRTVSNTFVACGVLYATRYLDKYNEEIFYSLDTVSGLERYDVGLRIKKMTDNIQSLNYSPCDQKLYAYSDSYVLTYQVVFG
ncbi:olfactomedin-4-like [Conger conger]|uniref:olfactomedin-4-like n=1 Tax=Conger conger TaxID=82655 RepID=UPI002A5AC364|nr:olfactomedin-4-like [Conger conger]